MEEWGIVRGGGEIHAGRGGGHREREVIERGGHREREMEVIEITDDNTEERSQRR
jgi:hypothetical protein